MILNKAGQAIRRASKADLPMIYGIEVRSFIEPYSPRLLINLFDLYPYGFYVAQVDGGVAGYLIMRIIEQKGHIIALAVDPSHRNKGLGSALVQQALETFKEEGVQAVWLEVRSSNRSAIEFYLKRGFIPLTTIPEYYGDGEDAEILYKPFSS